MNIWDALETMQRENNSRLFVIVEAADADHLLAVRDALKALTRAGVSKGRIANAKALLAQPLKEAADEVRPHHHADAVARPQPRRARRA
jgi:hypothetical protein